MNLSEKQKSSIQFRGLSNQGMTKHTLTEFVGRKPVTNRPQTRGNLLRNFAHIKPNGTPKFNGTRAGSLFKIANSQGYFTPQGKQRTHREMLMLNLTKNLLHMFQHSQIRK
jgi:hypothetical protein